MSFKNSLTVGQKGESLSRQALEKLGFVTKESNTKEIDFYFEHEDKTYSCECKYDLYQGKSGNLAIETYNTKICKPSGVMSTLADYWFHVLADNSIYFCRVIDLKKFLEEVKPTREVNGGDSNSFMKLYHKDKICDICLLQLTKENLIQEIEKHDILHQTSD